MRYLGCLIIAVVILGCGLGTLPPPGQAVTGDITLDNQDFPSAYYFVTMQRKIAALWQVPRTSPGEGMYCRVYFRVDRSGFIQSPAIEKSSGNSLFDQAALRAVVQASPLPPLRKLRFLLDDGKMQK